MNGDDLRNARAVLGRLYGLKRPLHKSEMGRALGFGGDDHGQSVRGYEKGSTASIRPPMRAKLPQRDDSHET